MTALLEVEDLRKNFGGGASLLGAKRATTRAVDSVSFTLSAGETLGLVGETGSGKSTLGRLVLRLIEPSGGRLRFEGQDVLRASASALRAMRPRMQMVFQDPYGSLDPRMTAGQIIAEPMKTQGMSRAEARERVGALLSLVGLRTAMAGRYPHEFSGGQRQRIGIARAIALDPALVVLAGFRRILTPAFVDRFAGRLTNIHPSLLPAFPGLHTHQRALDAGCKFAGVTVHLVTAELDHGPILDQAVVPVLAHDTADMLAARVLTQEHLIYPRAIARLLAT